MANPSEAQALPTAVPPTVQAGDRDYIVIDLNARSDDGRQKQAAFHWYAGRPDDQMTKTSKGHWFIDLEAFDLLIKWVQQQYPPLDHTEAIDTLERDRLAMQNLADQRARDFERAEAVRVGREDVFQQIIGKLITVAAGDHDDY